MKNITSDTVARYKFEDSKQAIHVIPIGHLLFLFCFIIVGVTPILTNPRILIIVSTLLLFWGLKCFYSWQSSASNLMLIGIYLLMVVAEFMWVGVPVYITHHSQTLTKSNLLDPFLAAVPLLYASLRVLLVYPLIAIFFSKSGIE